MVATWVLWLFVLGVAVGAVVVAVAVVRLPRRDDDVGAAERPTEAAWISAVIERNGGVAPALLVEEVLELHGAYLRQARPPVPPDAGPWAPVAAPPGWAPPGSAPPGSAPPGSAPPGSAPPGYVLPGSAQPGYPPSAWPGPGAPAPGYAPPGSAPVQPPPVPSTPPTPPSHR